MEPCPQILTEVADMHQMDAPVCTHLHRYPRIQVEMYRHTYTDMTDVYMQAAHLHTDVQTHTDTQMCTTT